jgi:pSer/pThr/pTyr-binding forkhead associated (FHA) protein
MASITISAEGVEQKIALEAASVTLGRGLESDVRLKDIKASRRHCQIVKTGGGYQCVDLSSGNGTFINGVQIKQQPLSPGDKIQIGSTTITFHDGGAAASASKASAPAAKTAAATGKTASVSRGATEQVAVAVTKKVTAKVPAVKPPTAAAKVGTQVISRQPTQSVPKPGTQSIAKPATGAVKKTTGRVPGSSRSIAKTSATQKFHKEAAKKKSNPVAVILVGIGVVFLGVVGYILFAGGGGGDDTAKERFDKLVAEGSKAENENKPDEALKKFREALRIVEGSDKFKSDAMTMKARIKEVEDSKNLMGAAQGRFEAFRKKFDEMKPEEANDLYKQGKQLESDYRTSGLSWLPELKVILERISKVLDTEAATRRREDFQVIRNELSDRHKLSRRSEAVFSGAVRDWKEYLKGKISDENRTKADGALRAVNQQAREELKAIEIRVRKMVENGNQAGAVEELKKQRARFEMTEVEADFQKLQSEIDK